MFCGPAQPDVGSHPSHTPKASSTTVASRNSGTAASIAANAPVVARPRTSTGATSAHASSTATPNAAPISASDTWSPETTEGRTSVPDTHEVPRSPRSTPEAQFPSRDSGPASRPRSRRTESRASRVGSCSAERARSTVSAGSRPESQGSRPTAARTATRQRRRVGPAAPAGRRTRALT
ncbi:hypothetical protein GCM10027072_68510 [Streptomyces bullii]